MHGRTEAGNKIPGSKETDVAGADSQGFAQMRRGCGVGILRFALEAFMQCGQAST
jgi:hypothetical protein